MLREPCPRGFRHARKTAHGAHPVHRRPRGRQAARLACGSFALGKTQTGIFCLRHPGRLVAARRRGGAVVRRRIHQSLQKRPRLCPRRIPRRHHGQGGSPPAGHPRPRHRTHGHAMEERYRRHRSRMEGAPADVGTAGVYENTRYHDPNPTAKPWEPI